MRELKGRVAVVTGAGGGIGRALCLELARHGVDVVAADVQESRAQQTAREVEQLGRRSLAVRTDVRHVEELQALLDSALTELGGCDLVFNNAGVFHAATLLDTPTEQWQRVLDTNLWGVIHGSRVFGAHFVAQGRGHIVNTASAAGLFPMPGMGSYTTTKYAIVGFSQQLRWELSDAKVGVTVLCPGVIRTGIGKAEGANLHNVDVDAIMANAPAPERLARKVIKAVRRNKPLVRLGPDAWALSFLRLLPTWLADPIGRFMGRTALAFLAQAAGEEQPTKAEQSSSAPSHMDP